MNATDIMSAPVVTVGPDAPVRDIAELLVRRRISGVPVVAGEQVIGIVSESDLLHRYGLGMGLPAPMAPWWRRLMGRQEPAIEYVRAHALRAKDIMTPDVISVAENTPLARIASILVERRIGRLPVLREGRLVGIVTRADLVAALGRRDGQVHAARPLSDESIRTQLLAELQQQRWWRPDWSVVWVSDGVVRYGGLVESEGERRAARVAAENVPGVRAVVDQRARFSDWQTML